MEEYSKLFTSIAALISAVAWPLAILVIILMFSSEIRLGLNRASSLLDRIKRASIAGIELEIENLANTEVGAKKNQLGGITPQQIETAARISKQDVSLIELRLEMNKLTIEYEAVRRALPPGNERMTAMTRVVVKMRSLALSLVGDLEIYKGSGSPGSRLAAVAIMQMDPRKADLQWLKERFTKETPFVFYHAALALSNFANVANGAREMEQLRETAREALATVQSFKDGEPDRNTIEVLKPLTQQQ